MKKGLTVLGAALIACSFFSAQASNTLTGCEAKKQQIKRQIQYAEMHGNHYRVNGLNRALQRVSLHCTDSSLLTERQHKVAEKQRKVQKREQELAEARIDGRQKKIAKKIRKRDEALAELREAQAALTQ